MSDDELSLAPGTPYAANKDNQTKKKIVFNIGAFPTSTTYELRTKE